MEFTDIAMELSKKAWQASFHLIIPLFYNYKRGI